MASLYEGLTVFNFSEGFDTAGIRDRIDRLSAFGVRFYYFDDIILDYVKSIVDAIFLRLRKPGLADPLYNGVKEVIINGLKANIKRIIFTDNGFDLDSESETEEGMRMFKEYILASAPEEIENELIRHNFHILIYFFLSEDGLRIEVWNNCELSEIEERRIRDKFRNSLKYRNIMEFMNDHGDSLEGAGLGLFLLVLMLRQMGVDPNYFRVGMNDEGYTVSRIEIPLSEKYAAIREDNS